MEQGEEAGNNYLGSMTKGTKEVDTVEERGAGGFEESSKEDFFRADQNSLPQRLSK